MAKSAKFIRYIILIFAFVIFPYGLFRENFNIALCGVLGVFLCNMIYSFECIKRRVIFLFFNLTTFVFLIARPFISMLRGDLWWYFTDKSVVFALCALFTTLLFLQFGAVVAEEYLKARRKKTEDAYLPPKQKSYWQSPEFMRSLQLIALAVFAVTMLCFLIVEAEKMVFMSGKEYEEFFMDFESKLPYALTAVSAMMKYALCIFLATLPSKRMAFIPLALYVVSALPSLIIGIRNPIVLNVIFVFLYYLLRDILVDTKKWMGRVEKTLVVIALPFALLFLSAYNYIRQGTEMATHSVLDTIVDLFYKQGVSFEVLCIGYNSIPDLPSVVPKNYTFGEFIDYFGHNSFAQSFFGAVDLGNNNSVLKATYGNSFAHSMSYVAREDYLQGHGWGTSYLLETYADYGFLGIILCSILFGFVFIFLVHAFQKGWFAKTITLIILLNLFFVPRAEATSWIFFICTQQFWITLLGCLLAAVLCAKQYTFRANNPLSSGRRHCGMKS